MKKILSSALILVAVIIAIVGLIALNTGVVMAYTMSCDQCGGHPDYTPCTYHGSCGGNPSACQDSEGNCIPVSTCGASHRCGVVW
jgi:hypothetical protein